MALLAALALACSGGGADQDLFRAAGSAVKSEIDGATVRAFAFDDFGIVYELTASNAPVRTEADGSFSFDFVNEELDQALAPVLIQTVGGTMGDPAGAAPTLEAVVEDLRGLSKGEVPVYLSTASSVHAGLVRRHAGILAERPSPEAVRGFRTQVESSLGVDLRQNPADRTTSVARVNEVVDANLDLESDPDNGTAVEDYIQYLVSNLSSASGTLDAQIANPLAVGEDTGASFATAGAGRLSGIFPNGTSDFRTLDLEVAQSSIANDGLEFARVEATILDATRLPVPDGTEVEFELLSGEGILERATATTVGGVASVSYTSLNPERARFRATNRLANGNVLSDEASVRVRNAGPRPDDTESPRVVSAVATGNNEVVVTFSEALQGGQGGAENAAFYRVVGGAPATDVPSQPTLMVMHAELIGSERTSVRLETYSQSAIQYTVTVGNLRDIAGNTFAPPDRFLNPSSASFTGVDGSGAEIVDSDGDGITDDEEQLGWFVVTTTAGGDVRSRLVTSDPTNPDTDDDGVPDGEERHAATDARSGDTDGDTLSDDQEWNTIFSDPTNQDTDGDGIQDGFEYYTFRTSPILADTDGDQLGDLEEVFAGNRNPLLSDLPAPRIRVGEVSLELDTRFSYTDEEGESRTEESSVSTTLTSSEDETFATSDESSTVDTLGNSQELSGTYSSANADGDGGTFPSYSVTAKVGRTEGAQEGSTFTSTESSSRSSEEAYQESLTLSSSFDVRETVTREVVGAAIKVGVSVESAGDIPFTISNIELSAQTQDPSDRRRVIPVASLVPENEGLDEINIGGLGDPARGPFVFAAADDVFPSRIEELMKNPRGLIVELANFDITDEQGRNFAFTSQDVTDRTAGITFDLGDGRTETYRVATASAHDPATGDPLGISMAYALGHITGLERVATIRDGGNGLVESEAIGDDEQLVTFGALAEPGEVLIRAGTETCSEIIAGDGRIVPTCDIDLGASVVGGDDVVVQSDYETRMQVLGAAIVDGGDRRPNTLAIGDDVQIIAPDPTRVVDAGQLLVATGADGTLDSVPGTGDVIDPAPAPRRVLVRYKDVELDIPRKRFWSLFSSRQLPAVDLDEIILRAGDQFTFAYVQDQDLDGVWAREEYLHGSSDLAPNSDGDSLSDAEEIQDGWRVVIKGPSGGARQVYPNPVQSDSDRDELTDDEEKACATDPRQRDSDLDGLTDWEELTGMRLIDGVATSTLSRDFATDEPVYQIQVYAGIGALALDASGVPVPGEVLVGHGELNLGECVLAGFEGYATDPTNPDTDGDMVSDSVELELGLNPNLSSDGPLFLDDDGDGVPNLIEQTGFTPTINGVPAGFATTSNPNDTDSDGDGLPDLLEHFLKSDPRSLDTDGDGLADLSEYRRDGDVLVTDLATGTGVFFQDRVADGYRQFVERCQDADVCNVADIQDELDLFSPEYGTNLNEADSDDDGLDDSVELGPSTITVNGNQRSLDPTSDPRVADTDGDGLDDGQELLTHFTDPNEPDTDGDGRDDTREVTDGTDPIVADKRIRLTTTRLVVVLSDDEGPNDLAELTWFGSASRNGVALTTSACSRNPGRSEADQWEVTEGQSIPVSCVYFDGSVTQGDTIQITAGGQENDDDSQDELCGDQSTEYTYNANSGTRTLSLTCNSAGASNDLEFNVEVTAEVFD